jgi:hypothetical protein
LSPTAVQTDRTRRRNKRVPERLEAKKIEISLQSLLLLSLFECRFGAIASILDWGLSPDAVVGAIELTVKTRGLWATRGIIDRDFQSRICFYDRCLSVGV